MVTRKTLNNKRTADKRLLWIIAAALGICLLIAWCEGHSNAPYDEYICYGPLDMADDACRFKPSVAYIISHYYLPPLLAALAYYAVRIGLLYAWKPFSKPQVFNKVWKCGVLAGAPLDSLLVILYVYYGFDQLSLGEYIVMHSLFLWALVLQIIGMIVGASRVRTQQG